MGEFGYTTALHYLEGIEPRGSQLGLERMQKALKLLGNPERGFKCAHVAGTNGKGSVCAMVASVLREAGYVTGLYTSPHISDVRERVVVDGKMVSNEDFAEAVGKVKGVDEQHGLMLTQFEALTAAAFLCFAKQAVHVAVLETGLGGRLDATNVVKPEVAVITNVEMEHVRELGKSVEEIAREKAGIIKKGCAVVTAEQKQTALAVIEEVRREKGCELLIVGRDIGLLEKDFSVNGTVFDAEIDGKRIGDLQIALLGAHQLLNAGCALGAIAELQKRRFDITGKALRSGLAGARWRGRFEIIDAGKKEKPVVVIDAAHNPAGMKALAVALKQYFPEKKFVFVLGIAEDKDLAGIAGGIAESGVVETVFATEAGHRARNADEIATEFKKRGVECAAIRQQEKALASALKMAGGKKAGVCVCGSIFLLSDLWCALR